jgi:hypothetical protein
MKIEIMKSESKLQPKDFEIKKKGIYIEIIICENIIKNEEKYLCDMILSSGIIRDYSEMVSAIIRCKYSIDKEFAIINKGIQDSNCVEYQDYIRFTAFAKEKAKEQF